MTLKRSVRIETAVNIRRTKKKFEMFAELYRIRGALAAEKENAAFGVRFKRVYAPLEWEKEKKPNFGWNVIKFEQKM